MFTNLLGTFKSGKSTQSHIKNLYEMALADGEFLDSEKELLKSIARRNGISDGQLADIQSHPGKIEFESPRDAKQRFHQLFDLVSMMNIDNQVHGKELELAKVFAVKFGYKPEIAKELVEVIQQNIKNGNTLDETMKRTQLMIA